MSTSLTLNTSAFCILDGDGNGTASTGPNLPGVTWQPETVAVSCSTNITESICSLYVGISPIAGSLIGTTSTGSTGDSDDIGASVYTGQSIIAVWTGGDPGATATMSIFGTKTVPGGS